MMCILTESDPRAETQLEGVKDTFMNTKEDQRDEIESDPFRI